MDFRRACTATVLCSPSKRTSLNNAHLTDKYTHPVPQRKITCKVGRRPIGPTNVTVEVAMQVSNGHPVRLECPKGHVADSPSRLCRLPGAKRRWSRRRPQLPSPSSWAWRCFSSSSSRVGSTAREVRAPTRAATSRCVPRQQSPFAPLTPRSRLAAEAVAESREGWELDPKEVQIPDVEQILGRGGFGTVYRGLLHGTHVAVKVVRYAKNKRAEASGFVQEVALMTKLHHPNICLILGVARDEAKCTLSIVTELLPVGSLCVSAQVYLGATGVAGSFGVLYSRSSPARPPGRYAAINGARWEVDDATLLQVALDATKGVAFLHGRAPPVVHRDIKSPNVLISSEWVGKIGDFGLSERSRNSHKTSGASAHARADVDVSPMWAAPEALRAEVQRPGADVFALATVVCVCCASRQAAHVSGSGARRCPLSTSSQVRVSRARPTIWRHRRRAARIPSGQQGPSTRPPQGAGRA